MAGVGEHGTGLGKGDGSEGSHPSPDEETSLGDPDPRQKGIPEPGWSGGWGCTAVRQHPGRKEAFQQRQGHGPGSDRRVSGHPHTMFEVSWFSALHWQAHCAVPPRFVIREYSCSPCLPQPWSMEISLFQNYGTHHLQQSSSQHQIHSGTLHIGQDKTTPSEGSDPTRQASATAFQQGESREMTMSWLEGRKLSVPQ